jgi:AP2 domain
LTFVFYPPNITKSPFFSAGSFYFSGAEIRPMIDLTGQTFGNLTVVERIGTRNHSPLWLCACKCGRTASVTTTLLRTGQTRSCKCLRAVPNKVEHRPDGTTVITIQRRNGEQFQCFIDTVDYDTVKMYQWGVLKEKRKHTCYATTNSRKPDGSPLRALMHRLLLPEAKQVDHEDRNGLNNRRLNLRAATQSLNNANTRFRDGGTSKYRGVSWYTAGQKFVANITVDNKQKYLGQFDSEEAAAIMYNIVAKRHFGEFANLNTFPEPIGEPLFGDCPQQVAA